MFEFIGDMSPSEVFETWRKNEEHLEHWKMFYESKGFPSWAHWRMEDFERFKIFDFKWDLYSLSDPKVILDFRGGPFRGWKNGYYNGEIMPTFREIVKNPKIKEHPTIREISENFPQETIMTGFTTVKGNFTIEGMHRCAAIALALSKGREIESTIFFAFAGSTYENLLDLYNEL